MGCKGCDFCKGKTGPKIIKAAPCESSRCKNALGCGFSDCKACNFCKELSVQGGFGGYAPEDVDAELGRASTSKRADDLMQELQDLVGLDSVKSAMVELRDMVEFDMWRKRLFGREKSLLGQSFHMRFLGNPGTG